MKPFKASDEFVDYLDRKLKRIDAFKKADKGHKIAQWNYMKYEAGLFVYGANYD